MGRALHGRSDRRALRAVRGVILLRPRAIVTDIEGTTTPIAFVTKTLFPYARARFEAFVRENAGDPAVAKALDDTRALINDENASIDAAIAALLRWSDEDRKTPPLKTLQGMIWRAGYESGALKAPVYDDAAKALRDWHKRGIRLAVYSSGSIAAQKLLFAHTDHGDLTPLFSAYFDLGTGFKTEAKSYAAIASALKLAPGEILFLSDHAGETLSARAAGLMSWRIERGRFGPEETSEDGEGLPVAGSFAPVARLIA